MLNIVIDTSVLRRDPFRRKVGFKTIERLAGASKIKLHFPDVVISEFSEHLVSEYGRQFEVLGEHLGKLAKRTFTDSIKERLQSFEREVSSLREEAVGNPRIEVREWAERLGATIHPISPSHGARVMRDYFNGSPPYKEKKSRQDIPDSFIWQSVLDLSEQEDIYVTSQ